MVNIRILLRVTVRDQPRGPESSAKIIELSLSLSDPDSRATIKARPTTAT